MWADGRVRSWWERSRPLVCRSELTLESEAVSVIGCELVLAEVVSVPGVDPVGVD